MFLKTSLPLWREDKLKRGSPLFVLLMSIAAVFHLTWGAGKWNEIEIMIPAKNTY